jgi:signal transduction histidine kinase
MDTSDPGGKLYARLSLLSKVGDLAGTLDYERVLSAVARLSIPELADWCIVDVAEERGEPRRMEVAHRDPAKASLAAALRAFKLDHAARRRLPVARALESRETVLIPDYTEERLRQETHGEYLALARRLEVRSVLVVPVTLSGASAGVTFFTTAESGRRYGPEDVAVAEELVRRAAQVVENARVHRRLAQALAFRDQVIGILGHDLRNPLGAVRALATLLRRRGDLPAGARESVAEIDRASERMLEMISTLLDFATSRFTGALPVAPVPVDLREVCRRVVDELRAASPGRRIELEVRGDAGGAWDPARIAQVVSNLVANALQHGARDAPVGVRVHGDGDGVALEVRNRGPAIAAELRAAMFEPFCRGSALRDASNARGLGLGLYIASEIVRAHGGTIDVESTAERGTTFTVRLPRRAAAAAREDGAAVGV